MTFLKPHDIVVNLPSEDTELVVADHIAVVEEVVNGEEGSSTGEEGILAAAQSRPDFGDLRYELLSLAEQAEAG